MKIQNSTRSVYRKFAYASTFMALTSLTLAEDSALLAENGIEFGTENDEPLLRKGEANSKDLELDLGDGGAFSIFPSLDGEPSFRAGEGNSSSVSAGKWYRIAQCADVKNLRASALFNLRDITSNAHSNVTFRTGMSFGKRSLMSMTLLSNLSFKDPVFGEIRYLSNGTFDEFYLEVKIVKNADVSYAIMENIANGGWEPVDWVETSSIPDGYIETNYELNDKLFMVAGESSVLNVNRTTGVQINGNFLVNGSPVMTSSISPYSVSHNGSQDAFLLEGTYVGAGASNVPVEGAGTRLLWYPEKAAFRVGQAQGD